MRLLFKPEEECLCFRIPQAVVYETHRFHLIGRNNARIYPGIIGQFKGGFPVRRRRRAVYAECGWAELNSLEKRVQDIFLSMRENHDIFPGNSYRLYRTAP